MSTHKKYFIYALICGSLIFPAVNQEALSEGLNKYCSRLHKNEKLVCQNPPRNTQRIGHVDYYEKDPRFILIFQGKLLPTGRTFSPIPLTDLPPAIINEALRKNGYDKQINNAPSINYFQEGPFYLNDPRLTSKMEAASENNVDVNTAVPLNAVEAELGVQTTTKNKVKYNSGSLLHGMRISEDLATDTLFTGQLKNELGDEYNQKLMQRFAGEPPKTLFISVDLGRYYTNTFVVNYETDREFNATAKADITALSSDKVPFKVNVKHKGNRIQGYEFTPEGEPLNTAVHLVGYKLQYDEKKQKYFRKGAPYSGITRY